MSAYVMLHGFTGSPAMWTDMADRLSAPVFAPWLGGHGNPAAPMGSRFEGEVDRLAELVRARGLESVHLVGYSLGARLALGLLVRHPSLFSRATLIGVNPGLDSDDARRSRLASDARWIELLHTNELERFVNAWSSQPMFANQPPAERGRRMQHTAMGLADALRTLGLGVMPDWSPHLPTLPMPVTFVAGENDSKFVEIARVCAARSQNGTLKIIERSGHNTVLERPDAVASLLEEETT